VTFWTAQIGPSRSLRLWKKSGRPKTSDASAAYYGRVSCRQLLQSPANLPDATWSVRRRRQDGLVQPHVRSIRPWTIFPNKLSTLAEAGHAAMPSAVGNGSGWVTASRRNSISASSSRTHLPCDRGGGNAPTGHNARNRHRKSSGGGDACLVRVFSAAATAPARTHRTSRAVGPTRPWPQQRDR
jgi:hypothetical protein